MSIQKALDWLVFGNFWIAIAACSCGWIVQWMGLSEASAPLLCLLFFATFLRYNLIGFTVSATAVSDKFRFAYQHRQWLKGFAIISAVICLCCAYFLNLQQLLVLGHLGVLSILYIFPLSKSIQPLRRLPYIKIFLIAYVWACSSWWLPSIQGVGFEYLEEEWFMVFAERFLFYFAITIPFDIRDLKTDSETSVKTIPLKLGVFNSKVLGTLMLLVAAVLSYYTQETPTFIGLLLGYLLALGLLWGASEHRGDHYSLGAVDGSMVFQALAIACMQSF